MSPGAAAGVGEIIRIRHGAAGGLLGETRLDDRIERAPDVGRQVVTGEPRWWLADLLPQQVSQALLDTAIRVDDHHPRRSGQGGARAG